MIQQYKCVSCGQEFAQECDGAPLRPTCMCPITTEDVRMTPEEVAAGYHRCPEWDDLVVGPDMAEWEADEKCCCGYAIPELKDSND